MATQVAAIAIGLSLVGGIASAAPDDRRGRNENAQQHKQGDQDRGNRTRRNNNHGPGVKQTQRRLPDFGSRSGAQQNKFDRSRSGFEGNRNWPSRPLVDRSRDNQRTFRDRNDRRDWGDRNRRPQVNILQYRRNFNAPRRFDVGVYRWRDGYSYRRYRYGQRLPRYFFARDFWLVNFFEYGLFAPPSGYVWVRYGPDALLIDEYTGEIIQVRYNMFY